MINHLSQQKCTPCQGNVPPLKGKELQSLFQKLQNHWSLVQEHHISKQFSFPDFKSALQFTINVSNIAEEQGHHPDIHLSWGKVVLDIWTHKIDGLTQNDFIFAAKVDQITS